MASAAVIRQRSRPLPSLLSGLSLIRSMGGGPRTFPGGLSKWQYKRMHEKMAREKERRLLQQEKQLYQARLRSEIRAKLAGDTSSAGGGASEAVGMTSKDHIKALADRFMKAGAEDLWNEDDGPLRSPRPRQSRAPNSMPPLDLRKLADSRHNLAGDRGTTSNSSTGFLEQRREYSSMIGRATEKKQNAKWRRNSSSEEEGDDSNLDLMFSRDGSETKRNSRLFPRFSILSDSEAEESDTGGGRRRDQKEMFSRAALRKHDVKTERRVPRHVRERSDFYSEIRDDLQSRSPFGNKQRQYEPRGDSLLTNKR